MTDQREKQNIKAMQFAALHRAPGAFVIPNPWDAGSSRILTALGFAALATTSAGLAFSLGRRDAEGAGSREEALANARAVVLATHLPVSADLEDGFGRHGGRSRDDPARRRDRTRRRLDRGCDRRSGPPDP
jgi:2-methylisocitrate lyase-like PEP mutase family enzyme